MSLLNQKGEPTLKGMKEVTVKSFREVSNDKGGYIEVKLNVPGRDKEYGLTIFPSQVNYYISTWARQYGLEPENTDLGELLERATTEPIKAYFSWNVDLGKPDVAFHQKNVESEEAGEF